MDHVSVQFFFKHQSIVVRGKFIGGKVQSSLEAWVYWDQLDAYCLVLFYYTFFTLHVLEARHGVERVNSHVHLPVSDCMCII